MRNKKLFVTIAVMLLVVFTLSLALVACKKKTGDPDDTPSGSTGETPPWVMPDPTEEEKDPKPVIPDYATSFKGAVEYMVESMPSEYLSLNFAGMVTVKGKKYTMSLKGNLADDDIQVAAVFKPEGSNSIAFAIYIVNSKLFFELEDGTILNVAEINANYLASIIDKVPDKISGVIEDLLGSYQSFIPLALDILLGGLSPSSKIKYEAENGVENFELYLDVQGLTKAISTIVGKGGLLELFVEGLDLSFIADLLDMIPLTDGQIKATVDNKRLSEFSLEFYDNDPQSETYRQTLVGFDSAITFSSTPLALEIPEGLENYESLTLGNLNFDVSFDIDTHGESFDLGALIDELLPLFSKDEGENKVDGQALTAPLFGKGVLVLRGDADYRLDLKASLDPNIYGSDTDNNYINIVLWVGNNQLVRANYIDGKIYVKALADGINGFAEGGINIAIPLDLKDYISQLVEKVTDMIDGLLGTEYAPATSGAILTASIGENGETILSPSLQNVIMGVLKLVGFENSVVTSGDKITVVIDKTFFDALNKLVKPQNPISLPIFGELVLGLHKGGIEYLEVTAMEILTLRADGFHLGRAQISRQDVLDSIGNTEDYGENIESIIKNFAVTLLSDLELSLDLDVSTVNSTVNLTSIINSVMAVAGSRTYLRFPIALDLSKYDGTFKLRIASNYDNENGDGRVLLELITPNKDILISAYNENSNTYVDLTGLGFMKFCLTNVNLFQIIRGLLGADMPVEDYLEEVAPAMAMSAFTSGVEIDDEYVDVAVNSYFVTMIMRMLAMDLGLDLDLKAHLNFNGSVSAELGLGNAATLGLTMSLGKESETEYKIADVINGLPKEEYGEYNAVDAEMLVDSILIAERLNLTIDLYNQNVNNSSHENKTRIVIRNSKATKNAPEILGNGMEAPYKSIVLIIYAGWTNDTSQAMIYGYIDFNNAKIQIKLAARALEGITALGIDVSFLRETILKNINIPIDMDLRQTLIDALSGLFGSSDEDDDNFGGVIEVPDGVLPPHKPHKCSKVCPTCGNCLDADCQQEACVEKCTADEKGVHPTPAAPSEPKEPLDVPPIEQIINLITVSLTGSMDVDVDADISGSVVSKLLNDLLTGVFGDMDISSIVAPKGTEEEKKPYRHVKVTYSNTETITVEEGTWPNKKNVEYGLFTYELYENVVLPIINAQASGVSGLIGATNLRQIVCNLVARFLPLSDVQDITANVSVTDGRLANISLIGSNPGGHNAQGFGIYIFNRKADSVISWESQDTNIYFNPDLGGELKDMFVKQARKHVEDNWEEDSWRDITWTLKGYGTDLATFSNNITNYDDGKYIFVGTAWDTSIEVTVNLHTSQVVSVKDMQVKAMRDIPTYVTAVFADGTERLIPDVEIDCDRANGENNASVTLGGEEYTFTIVFEDEEISLETLTLNAYDYVDVINELKESRSIRVKVNDTFYRNLPATYDFSMFTDKYLLDENGEPQLDDDGKEIPNPNYKTRQDLQKSAKYQIDVHVGEGTDYERNMVLTVEFTPFTIYYIEVDELHYIQTDFIEYSKDKSVAFPEEITVVGYNGKEWLKYTATAEWDTSAVIVDLKGGQYFASAVLNKGEFNEWKMEGIEVEVLSTDIVGLSNSNKSVVFDWKYYFYGKVPVERCYPTLLNFKTSSGTIKRDVPVTIDLSSFLGDANLISKAMVEGITIDCPISIDVEGVNLDDDATIQVVIPSIKMSLENDVIEIKYDEYVEYGKSAFFADKMEILLGEDKVMANVTWFTDEVRFNKDGTYTAIVYIAQDTAYEQSCEVTVKITGAPTVEEV